VCKLDPVGWKTEISCREPGLEQGGADKETSKCYQRFEGWGLRQSYFVKWYFQLQEGDHFKRLRNSGPKTIHCEFRRKPRRDAKRPRPENWGAGSVQAEVGKVDIRLWKYAELSFRHCWKGRWVLEAFIRERKRNKIIKTRKPKLQRTDRTPTSNHSG